METFAEEKKVQPPIDEQYLIATKVVGLTDLCGGASFPPAGQRRLLQHRRGISARERSGRRKDIRLPFLASHCPVSDYEVQSQGSQAEASIVAVDSLGKASALPSRQNSEKELAGFYSAALCFSFVLLLVEQTAS